MSKLRRGYLEGRSWVYLVMYELECLNKRGRYSHSVAVDVCNRSPLER